MNDRIVVLTDGKAGHENQSKAFARSLGGEVALVGVKFKSKLHKALSYLLDRLGIRTLSLVTLERSVEGARAVVGTGSGTFYAVKALARRLGAKGGVVLAEIALRSDSLWPAMATHFTMNATQMILAYLAEHAPGAEDVEVIEVEAPLFDFMYVMIFAFITLVTLPLLTRCIGAMKPQRIEITPAVTELAFVPDEPDAAPKKTFSSRMAAMYVALGLGLLLLIITEVALRAM